MPQFLPAMRFSDIESLGSAVGWDLDFRQLDRGPFTGRASVLATDKAAVMQVELGRSFHQRGFATPGKLTFGLVDPGSSEVHWHGTEANGQMLDFNDDSGFDGVSTAGMRGHTLSVSAALMNDAAKKLGLVCQDEVRTQHRLWRDGGSGRLVRLRGLLGGVLAEHARQGSVAHPHADRELEQMLAEEMLVLMNHGELTLTPERWRRHMSIRNQALDYIEQNLDEPLTVADVCAATGVSWATLDRVFRRHVGQSPKRYIRSLRLQRVRQALLDDRSGQAIADVANRWGFWHLGQFARDYRRQFHELPRETAGDR